MSRHKGSTNRISQQAKADLAQAFLLLGGVPALVAWGRVNPTAFYALWSKLIPRPVDIAVSEQTGPQIVLNAVEVANPEEALSVLERMLPTQPQQALEPAVEEPEVEVGAA